MWQFFNITKSLRIWDGQISVVGSQTAFPLKILYASFSYVPRMCSCEIVGFHFILVYHKKRGGFNFFKTEVSNLYWEGKGLMGCNTCLEWHAFFFYLLSCGSFHVGSSITQSCTILFFSISLFLLANAFQFSVYFTACCTIKKKSSPKGFYQRQVNSLKQLFSHLDWKMVKSICMLLVEFHPPGNVLFQL